MSSTTTTATSTTAARSTLVRMLTVPKRNSNKDTTEEEGRPTGTISTSTTVTRANSVAETLTIPTTPPGASITTPTAPTTLTTSGNLSINFAQMPINFAQSDTVLTTIDTTAASNNVSAFGTSGDELAILIGATVGGVVLLVLLAIAVRVARVRRLNRGQRSPSDVPDGHASPSRWFDVVHDSHGDSQFQSAIYDENYQSASAVFQPQQQQDYDDVGAVRPL